MFEYGLSEPEDEPCAFLALGIMVPELLELLRLQRAQIQGLLSFKSVILKADDTEIVQLKMRTDSITHLLIQWAKAHRKDLSTCPHVQKP